MSVQAVVDDCIYRRLLYCAPRLSALVSLCGRGRSLLYIVQYLRSDMHQLARSIAAPAQSRLLRLLALDCPVYARSERNTRSFSSTWLMIIKTELTEDVIPTGLALPALHHRMIGPGPHLLREGELRKAEEKRRHYEKQETSNFICHLDRMAHACVYRKEVAWADRRGIHLRSQSLNVFKKWGDSVLQKPRRA